MASEESGAGRVLWIGLGLVMAVFVIVFDILDLPPVSTINYWQASMMGGKYYPKLTALILFLAVAIPFALVIAVVKAVWEALDSGPSRPRRRPRRDLEDEPRRRRGRSRREEEEEDEDEPAPRRNRRRDDDAPPDLIRPYR